MGRGASQARFFYCVAAGRFTAARQAPVYSPGANARKQNLWQLAVFRRGFPANMLQGAGWSDGLPVQVFPAKVEVSNQNHF